MSKYELLFAQASDTEGRSFRMIFVPEMRLTASVMEPALLGDLSML